MNTTTLILKVWMAAACFGGVVGLSTSAASETGAVPDRADQVRPLAVGADLPALTLRNSENQGVDLNAAIRNTPTVLIFYRGGWCPYCTAHLGQLQTIDADLRRLGYQILAISPDRPEVLRELPDDADVSYTLLSDSRMEAAKAFGIAFRVEDETVKRYKGFGIDLEEASGHDHHLLPVPAVFIIGTDEVIRFSYVNSDYKVRLEPKRVLEAAKAARDKTAQRVAYVLARVEAHSFHPVRNGFTYDRRLNTHGVADLNTDDWRVRTLAVRDLVRLGNGTASDLIAALEHTNPHVRHVAAMTLGVLQVDEAIDALEKTLLSDKDSVVRSQAAIALRQIGRQRALTALRRAHAEDSSRDVRHQAELAVYAVENGYAATPELAEAYRDLEASRFNQIRVGSPAVDFELPDTEGNRWRLSDFRGKKPVVLIWIFADWCPVCHGEFHELIELRQAFKDADIEVATLQCHDIFPARVMVGKEVEPDYWFSDISVKEAYTDRIWWPHLADRAGGVAAIYGVQPMAFVVHSEWINRPSVVIVDKEGIVRFAYYGTFWGDRPTIRELIDMVRNRHYEFTSDKRLAVHD